MSAKIFSLCCFGDSSHLDARSSQPPSTSEKRWSAELGHLSEALRSNDTIARLPTAQETARATALHTSRSNRLSRYEQNPTLRHSFRRPSYVSDTSSSSSSDDESDTHTERRPSFVAGDFEKDTAGECSSEDSLVQVKSRNRLSAYVDNRLSQIVDTRLSQVDTRSRAATVGSRPSGPLKRESTRSVYARESIYAMFGGRAEAGDVEVDPTLRRMSVHGADVEKILRQEHERQIKATVDPGERRAAVERERKRRAQWNRRRGHDAGR